MKKFIKCAKSKHNNKYDYSKVNYINTTTKIIIICPTHGEFKQVPYSHLRGSGCPQCVIHKKKSNDEFIYQAKEKHGNKYNYSEANYINYHTKIKIICPKHGIFLQTPQCHLKGSGCSKCAREKSNKNILNKRKIKTNMKEKFNKIHSCKYDYSLFENYKNLHERISIICPDHGVFKQTINNHKRGIGCPKCASIKTTSNLILRFEVVKNKSNHIHNNKYDYSKVNYINYHTKIEITCPKHGSFLQTPRDHISKKAGCPKCGIKKISNLTKSNTKDFIKKSNVIHKFKYDYSQVDYILSRKKVKIICPKHGIFLQTPNHHLNGLGCPNCGYVISKPSQIWLDILNIPKKFREKIIFIDNKKYIVDAYDKNKNTVYEFWGDFWHGNPKIYNENDINPIIKKTYGYLYEKTLKKISNLKKGFVLIDIWEKDFKEKYK